MRLIVPNRMALCIKNTQNIWTKKWTPLLIFLLTPKGCLWPSQTP